MIQGSRVKRKRNADEKIGTIIELNGSKARIKWDVPTVNKVTGAVQRHSTIDVKDLIDINFVPSEVAIEDKQFDLFNQQ